MLAKAEHINNYSTRPLSITACTSVISLHLITNQTACPFVKIKFKDFSKTFKDHTKDI